MYIFVRSMFILLSQAVGEPRLKSVISVLLRKETIIIKYSRISAGTINFQRYSQTTYATQFAEMINGVALKRETGSEDGNQTQRHSSVCRPLK